jgi:hypothetical protein
MKSKTVLKSLFLALSLTVPSFAQYYTEGNINIEDGKGNISFSASDPSRVRPTEWVYYLFVESKIPAQPKDIVYGNSRPWGCIMSKNLDDAKRMLDNSVALEKKYGRKNRFISSNYIGPVAVYFNAGDNSAFNGGGDDKTMKDAFRLKDTLENLSKVYDTINEAVNKEEKIQNLSSDEFLGDLAFLRKGLMRVNAFLKNPWSNTDINSDTLKNIYKTTKSAADNYRPINHGLANQNWMKAQEVLAANTGFSPEKEIQTVQVYDKFITVTRTKDECKNTYTIPKKNSEGVTVENDSAFWKVTVLYGEKSVGLSYSCTNKPQVLSTTAYVDLFFSNENDAQHARDYFNKRKDQ